MTRAKLIHVLLLAVLVLVPDQITKKVVAEKIEHLDSITVVECCVHLAHVHNRGGAFGMFSSAREGWKKVLFTGASFAALGFLIYLIVLAGPAQRFQLSALAIILGGAVGNLWDRIRQGFVVDFIDVHYQNWHWPAFNIADIAITVGIALILLEMIVAGRTEVGAPAQTNGPS